jgi:hypothetical protein
MQILKPGSILLLLSALFGAPESIAQELSAKWSETFELNTKELFFDKIAGESSTNLYVVYTDKFYLSAEPSKKEKLVAVDKNSFLPVSTLHLKGFSENKKEHAGLDFHTCVIRNDQVLIFWSKNTDVAEELYLEVFDANLKVAEPIRKIYVNEHAHDLKRAVFAKDKSAVVVAFHENRKEDLLIGGEIPVANAYVRFEYTLLSGDGTTTPLQSVALPVQMRDKSYGLSATYEYLENGDVVIRNSYTGEAGKGVTENVGEGMILLSNMNPYHTVSYLKTTTHEISTIELPVAGMAIHSPSLKSIIVGNELRTYGLSFSDKSELTGLFCGRFTIDQLSATQEYIPFDQPTLDSLGNKVVLKDVLVKNNRLVFFIIPYSQGTIGSTLINYHILGYDADHELQWSTKRPTVNSLSSFNMLTGSDEVLVFFGTNKRDESKKMHVVKPGANIIGYSRLNLTTGELI